MNLNKILNQIDVVELGEILMNKAESILYSDYNIIVLKIEYEDLKSENFENMQEFGSVEYGDWETLKNFVSESEVERIKNQFDDDLKDFEEDEDSDIDDCLRLSASNDEKYQSLINNDSPINEDLLKNLIKEYPLLSKLHQKLNIV